MGHHRLVAHRIGFLVNPIAGMGGRVGLKGTDGVVDLAVARGAVPSAGARAGEMLASLSEHVMSRSAPPAINWITCAGAMGEDSLRGAGFDAIDVVYEPEDPPSERDTRRAVRSFIDVDAELILFCGGDGTARDVCAITRRRVPILGIPAGVKMYSGVFGISPARTAEILIGFLEDRLGMIDADVLDVDEERFRAGELQVKLYDTARTPHEPQWVQSAKQVIEDRSEEHSKAQIAEHLAEQLASHPDTLFLLGPGSTVASVAHRNGLAKSLLGVDAVLGGELIGSDPCEREILDLLDAHPRAQLVLSPIGAQGFVLGRGNQQLSPEVVRRIPRDDIVVVATPMKLARTPVIHFDTGDPLLDAELAANGFFPVVTGYHVRRLVEVRI